MIDPPGNAARSRSSGVAPVGQRAAHGRHQVLHECVGLQAAELRHADALGPADARQVVAQQIDDHHVLGPVLLALPAFRRRHTDRPRAGPCGCRVPLIGRASTWPSRTCRNRSGEALTICVVAQIEVAGERGRIAPPQAQVQATRVVVGRVEQPLGEVHLKHVAGVNVFDRPANGRQVVARPKVAGQTPRGPGTAILRRKLLERQAVDWQSALAAAIRRAGRRATRETAPSRSAARRRRAAGLGLGKALRDDPGLLWST